MLLDYGVMAKINCFTNPLPSVDDSHIYLEFVKILGNLSPDCVENDGIAVIGDVPLGAQVRVLDQPVPAPLRSRPSTLLHCIIERNREIA